MAHAHPRSTGGHPHGAHSSHHSKSPTSTHATHSGTSDAPAHAGLAPAGALLHTSGSTAPTPASTFAGLGLGSPILQSLQEQGYSTPTPIQAQALPPIMMGKDVLGCAQTGTGKTAAFALPILHRLVEQPVDKTQKGPTLPRVLVLAPTRELVTQIAESFGTYGRHTGFRHTTVFGGVSQFHQVKALQRGVDVLIATPGRLIDLMQQRLVNLSRVGVFVLDEADRMLDMGFIKPIQQIASALPRDGKRQTLLFSATMPREIQHLAEALLREPVRIAVAPVSSAAPLIEQRLYHVHKLQKPTLLVTLLEDLDAQRAVVFTKTKHGADKVQRRLKAAGISSDAIHGNKAQNYRTRALNSFRDGSIRVLVATDVAARGLDVDDVTHVFNYDLPMEPESYVHRIGRTGRMGKQGLAIAFCDSEERDLLRQMEKLMGKKVPVHKTPELPDVEELASAQAARTAAWEHNRGRGPARGSSGNGRGERRSPEAHAETGLHRDHGRTHPKAHPTAQSDGHGGQHRSQAQRSPREDTFLGSIRVERDERPRGNDHTKPGKRPHGGEHTRAGDRAARPPERTPARPSGVPMRVAGDDHGDDVMPQRSERPQAFAPGKRFGNAAPRSTGERSTGERGGQDQGGQGGFQARPEWNASTQRRGRPSRDGRGAEPRGQGFSPRDASPAPRQQAADRAGAKPVSNRRPGQRPEHPFGGRVGSGVRKPKGKR